FMITNSGSDRNSVAWHEHEWAVKVAAGHEDALTDPTFIGRPLDDELFSYVCALDDGDDPLNDPSCWIKANPLLGVTITEEYLASFVVMTKCIPVNRYNCVRLLFFVWLDGDVVCMSREVIVLLLVVFDPVVEHKGTDVFLGLDFSLSSDLTA